MGFTNTALWKRLEVADNDPHADLCEDLRSAFRSARESAAQLAPLMERDQPSMTKHDLAHLDALWERASDIVGPDLQLNPLETFVLGIAFLVHDLGMVRAAFAGGYDEIRSMPQFRAAVGDLIRRRRADPPPKTSSSIHLQSAPQLRNRRFFDSSTRRRRRNFR